MSTNRPGLATRAVRKTIRLSQRFRERVSNVPIRFANRGLPLPPSRLIHLVAGTNDLGWFLGSGARAATAIRESLRRHGFDVNNLGSLLDFGCGAGRVLRHWQDLTETRVCGSDYNPALVGWSRRTLPFADIRLNSLNGPVDWPAESFGLVYALSVFTHLTKDGCASWMNELRRVLRPGGLLLITTHGDAYAGQLAPDERQIYDAGQPVVVLPRSQGSNDCATFHPPVHVRQELAKEFEVLEHVPEGALGNPRQDLWLLRKPL